MKKNKKSLLLVSVVCASTVLAGCMNRSSREQGMLPENQETEEQKEKVQIGLSVDSFVIGRWVHDRDVFVNTARELGAEVNVQDAGGDSEEQVSQIEYLIQKEMDVIVVIARDCDSLEEVLKKAQDRGIRVISYDRLIHHGESDLYISFDSREVGVLMAEAMIEAIPDGGDIFMIQGSADDDNVPMIKDGFDDTIKNSKLNVVYETYCEGWLAELAVPAVEAELKEYPDVKGIMCGNDEIASQVVHVLAENRLAGKVIVVGQDGDVAACQRIVEGTQYMTAFKDVENEARCAAEYAVRLGKGETPADIGITESVDDGTFDVPAEVLMPVAVKRENMVEVIIEGGYHQKEDVYLNVAFENAEETGKKSQ